LRRKLQAEVSAERFTRIDLAMQIGAGGATWLDRELVFPNRTPLVQAGIGADASRARSAGRTPWWSNVTHGARPRAACVRQRISSLRWSGGKSSAPKSRSKARPVYHSERLDRQIGGIIRGAGISWDF
jgi:hypothetical protein